MLTACELELLLVALPRPVQRQLRQVGAHARASEDMHLHAYLLAAFAEELVEEL